MQGYGSILCALSLHTQHSPVLWAQAKSGGTCCQCLTAVVTHSVFSSAREAYCWRHLNMSFAMRIYQPMRGSGLSAGFLYGSQHTRLLSMPDIISMKRKINECILATMSIQWFLLNLLFEIGRIPVQEKQLWITANQQLCKDQRGCMLRYNR